MKQRSQSQPAYLTPEAAAAMAGMSRPAFLKHVAKGNIEPIITVNKRCLFLPEAVKQWAASRRKNGTKKRGPQPQDGKTKSRKES